MSRPDLIPSEKPAPAAVVRPLPGLDPQDAWVQRQQRGVWRFLRMAGCPRDLADDLAQDALLAALHKRIDLLPDDESARWLRAAARNLWRMHLRAQGRRPALVALELAEGAIAQHGADDGGDAFVLALRHCMTLLDGRARTAIERRYRDDAPRQAIAAALGLSEHGAKSLLQRTRELLTTCVKRQLRRHGERP